jgi:predicted NAD/FAD-binding protein
MGTAVDALAAAVEKNVPTGTYAAATVMGGVTAPGAVEIEYTDGRIARFDSVNR